MPQTAEKIKRVLEEKLGAEIPKLLNESAHHAGHAGASGGGHFQAVIVSPRFEGLGLLDRQRLVYHALGDLMKTEIHAFSMKTMTPDERKASKQHA